MKKALILGGSYFIGKKIAETVSRAGYEVFVLNRGTKPPPDGTQSILCDRDDRAKMTEALKDFRFSAVVDVSGLNGAQAETAGAALCGGVEKFVFISSSAVYDIENLTPPFKETDPLAENRYWTWYGKNKIDAEAYYSGLFAGTGTQLVILRPPYVYGENNYAQRESFIFDHLCRRKPILLPSSNPRLQFIYAFDLADTVLHLIRTPLPERSVFNLGNRDAVTSGQWIEACAEAARETADIVVYDHRSAGRRAREFFPFQDYDSVLDVSAVKALYGAETPFIDGLRNSFQWFLENRDSIRFNPDIAQNENAILQSLGLV